MPPIIQGPLEIAHVGILLRIDFRIREQYGEIAIELVNEDAVALKDSLNHELHRG